MSRLLPFPLVSAGLLVIWLLLNQALSPGHILVGAIVAIVAAWPLAALEAPKARPVRLSAVTRLAALVLADILRSNVAVARIILGMGRNRRSSGFIDVPLELRHPYGLAALACIITATPGTVWVHFDRTRGILTIHVLDLVDKADWIHIIKGRYERPLLEIFT